MKRGPTKIRVVQAFTQLGTKVRKNWRTMEVLISHNKRTSKIRIERMQTETCLVGGGGGEQLNIGGNGIGYNKGEFSNLLLVCRTKVDLTCDG